MEHSNLFNRLTRDAKRCGDPGLESQQRSNQMPLSMKFQAGGSDDRATRPPGGMYKKTQGPCSDRIAKGNFNR